MQNTSVLYNSILAGDHSFEVRAVAGNNVYTHANMYSMTEYNTLFSSIGIGNCISRKLELVLYNRTPDNLQTIIPQIRAVNDTDESEWISKGVFYVDTIQSSPLTTNTVVTAYDAMLKAEVIYFKTGTWVSKTGIEVLTEIASDMGINIESGTITEVTNAGLTIDYVPVSGDKGTTEREMLSYIAMMCGGNFYINDANELELVLLAPIVSDDVDLGRSYVDLSISNSETVVGVRMWSGDDTYYYAPSNITIDQWEALVGDKIECTCPYANQNMTDSLFTRLGGLIYQPYSMSGAFVDPAAELGDSILLNNTYHVYLADQKLHFDQLGQSDLAADATQSINSLYPMSSPVEREVAKASAGLSARLSVAEGSIQAEVIRAEGAEDALSNTITATASELSVQLQDHALEQSKYVRYSLAGLELGDVVNKTKAILTDEKLSFISPDGDEKAYIGQDDTDGKYKFFVVNGHIVNQLELGDHWILVASGDETQNRLTFKWRG